MSAVTPSPPIPYGGAGVKYCQRCGAPNDPDAAYCTRCGEANFRSVRPGRIDRPLGVTLLALLQILVSVATILIGLFATTLLLFIPFLSILGLFFAGLGVIELILAVALFSGRNWARILNIIFAVIWLIHFPLGTIMGILFLIYFTRPGVVAYFRQPH